MVASSLVVSGGLTLFITAITLVVMNSKTPMSGILAYAAGFFFRMMGLVGYAVYVLGQSHLTGQDRQAALGVFLLVVLAGGALDIVLILFFLKKKEKTAGKQSN